MAQDWYIGWQKEINPKNIIIMKAKQMIAGLILMTLTAAAALAGSQNQSFSFVSADGQLIEWTIRYADTEEKLPVAVEQISEQIRKEKVEVALRTIVDVSTLAAPEMAADDPGLIKENTEWHTVDLLYAGS